MLDKIREHKPNSREQVVWDRKTEDYINLLEQTIQELTETRDKLRKYLSASAHDYDSMLDRLSKVDYGGQFVFEEDFRETARELRETSQLLRDAAELKDVEDLYEDELSKVKQERWEAEDRGIDSAIEVIENLLVEGEVRDRIITEMEYLKNQR